MLIQVTPITQETSLMMIPVSKEARVVVNLLGILVILDVIRVEADIMSRSPYLGNDLYMGLPLDMDRKQIMRINVLSKHQS